MVRARVGELVRMFGEVGPAAYANVGRWAWASVGAEYAAARAAAETDPKACREWWALFGTLSRVASQEARDSHELVARSAAARETDPGAELRREQMAFQRQLLERQQQPDGETEE
jgi:hypothetical protein